MREKKRQEIRFRYVHVNNKNIRTIKLLTFIIIYLHYEIISYLELYKPLTNI